MTSSAPTATTSTSASAAPSTTVAAAEAPTVAGEVSFPSGVAAGEPDLDSVVLWTQLAPTPATGDLEVAWDVATDPDFTTLWASGLTTVRADHGHTTRVIAPLPPEGGWYRFRAGPHSSEVGRLAPPFDGRPLRLAATSCQNPSSGAWAAHRQLARTQPDLVVWLGDFIYESGQQDLDQYRAAYAAALADPDLQAARASAAWLVLLDDNDIANDLAAPDTPGATDIGDQRRLAGLQAWWEHHPTRLERPEALPPRLWRRQELGSLGTLLALDTRLQRTATELIGSQQAGWLSDQLATTDGWALVASPVLVSGFGVEPALLPYGWEAYPADRALLTEADHPVVALSGDLHTGLVGQSGSLTELMAPAISSQLPDALADVAPLAPLVAPEIRWIDPTNGWLEIELGTDELTARWQHLTNVADPGSGVTVGAEATLSADGALTGP